MHQDILFDWRIFRDYLRLLITLQLHCGFMDWCFVSLVLFLRPGLNYVDLIFLWTSSDSPITFTWTILPSLSDKSSGVTIPNPMSFIFWKGIPYRLMSLPSLNLATFLRNVGWFWCYIGSLRNRTSVKIEMIVLCSNQYESKAIPSRNNMNCLSRNTT